MASFIAYVGSGLLLLIAVVCLLSAFSKEARTNGQAILGCLMLFVIFLSLSLAVAYLGGI